MSNIKELIIVGSGGMGREAIQLAMSLTEQYNLIGFLDDTPSDLSYEGVVYQGQVSDWKKFANACFVIACGAPRVRAHIFNKMLTLGTPNFATLIDKEAHIGKGTKIGEGTIIMKGAITTTDVKIGSHSIVNLASTISHDGVIERFCTLAPKVALSGNVTLKEGAEIGINASIRQGITIGEGALVGMSSAVIKDVSANVEVVGVPAKHNKDLVPFSILAPNPMTERHFEGE